MDAKKVFNQILLERRTNVEIMDILDCNMQAITRNGKKVFG